MIIKFLINSLGLIIFSLNFNYCSTFKQDSKIILTKEIEMHMSLNESVSKHYLDFKLNDYLKYYIQNTGNSIFENEDINLLTKQLKIKKYVLDCDKVIQYNFESDGDRLSNISKNRLYLSNPVFLKNRNSVMIAVASGYKDAMEGSIHLYNKVNDEWVLESIFNGWIE